MRLQGVDFEVKEIELGQKEQLKPDFYNHSITGRVPALNHNEFWLAESSAIIEYVDETFEPKGMWSPIIIISQVLFYPKKSTIVREQDN